MTLLTSLCKHCNYIFAYTHKTGAYQKYCSSNCRMDYNRVYQRQWAVIDRKSKPDTYKANAAAQRSKHREKIYARTRKWFADNRDYQYQKNREWREANPGYFTKWKQNHRERVCIASHNRRVIKELAGTFTIDEWKEVVSRQNGQCVFFHLGKCNGILTQDHILPLSRGGANTINNIQALCFKCNARKGHRTNEEFLSGISVPRGARNKRYVRLKR